MTFPVDKHTANLKSARSCAGLSDMRNALHKKSPPRRTLSSHALKGIKRVLSDSSKQTGPEDDSLFESVIYFNPSNPQERAHFEECERELKKYIRRHPEALEQKYDFPVGRGGLTVSRYPLSALVALGASLSLVKLAIKANPSALKSSQDLSSTVLHTACSFDTDMEVIRYIYHKHPDAIEETTKLVFLPLHNACAKENPSLEVIQFLVEEYPEGLMAINKLGDTPLRIAKRNKTATTEVLSYLEQETKRVAALEENKEQWKDISERQSWGSATTKSLLSDVALSNILFEAESLTNEASSSSFSTLSDPEL